MTGALFIWQLLPADANYLLMAGIIWTLFWKGWALWEAGRNNSKNWFTVLFFINTVGLLEILYIFKFSKSKQAKKKK